MTSARDELEHVAETLSKAEAERVLELLHAQLPELFGRLPTYPVIRGDGHVVRVTVPERGGSDDD